MVLVDIVMPFYGSDALLREAVTSVVEQSDPRWRLIVLDDANPDPAPGRWVQTLDDPRVSYRRNEVNGGVAASFRQAVTLAQNELLVIMGCDDRLLPGFVETAISAMTEHPDASYLQPGVGVIDEHGRPSRPVADRIKAVLRPKGPGALLTGQRLARSLLVGNWTYFPSIVWRTPAVQRYSFDPRYDVVLDLQLQLEIVAAGGALLVHDRTTFQYRRHSQSVSSVTARDGVRFGEERALFTEWAERFASMGWRVAARAARWHITSRLNALTLLPGARGDAALRRDLLHHALGKTVT